MKVQSAFADLTQHTDPFVNLCRALLNIKVVRKHEQAQVLDRSTCGLFLRCLITFLDSQINGAVFMLQRTLRKIPLTDKFTNQLKMQEIVKELESIKTSAGILIDIMGFRKTYMTLLFLSYYALYTPHTHMNGTLDHCLIICIVLSGIILNQWQTVIVKYFPHLHLIIGQGDQLTDKKYAQRWVSSLAMWEALKSLANWPQHLRAMFDSKNPQASRTILLTSYETWAARSMSVKKRKTKKGKWQKVFTSRWVSIFKVVILDEGHKLRHPWMKLHVSVYQLNALVHWFLTATLITNDALVSYSSYLSEEY